MFYNKEEFVAKALKVHGEKYDYFPVEYIYADEKVKTLAKLRDTSEYHELEQLYTVGIKPIRHEDVSGAIKGKSTIYNYIKEVLENAKKEVIICTSVDEIKNKSRFFSSIFDRLNKNGIKMKIAFSGDEKTTTF
jgi:sugar-specific transcriptional regulator TrmB